MPYQLYTKNESGEIVAVTPGIDERVSNLESKSIAVDKYKVDTREQTLTTEQKEQVVKNLDGTFLPLTGGNIRGSIMFNNLGSIIQDTNSEHEELLIFAHDQVNNWPGGLLSCRGHSGSNEAEHGSFALGARLKDGSGGSYLVGLTSGNLLWRGKEVERADGFYAAQFNGGYCDVHRYVTGLQIITAGFQIPANQLGVTLTFTRPFINTAYGVAVSGQTPNGDVAVTYEYATTTSIRFCRKSYIGEFGFTLYAKCIIIGRWL